MRKRHFKHLFLAFLILLSIYLSFNLWVPKPAELPETSVETDNQVPGSLMDRHLHGVYSPVNYVSHQGLKILLDPTVYNKYYIDLIDGLYLDDLGPADKVPLETFRANLDNLENIIELVYSDPLPFGIFTDNFSNIPTDLADTQFDRIIIDLNQPESVVFYNTRAEELTRVSVVEVDLQDFREGVQEDNYLYSVYAQSLGNNYAYLPTQEVNMERRHYTVERLPNNLYSSYFFPDPSGVELRVSNNISRYIDLTAELRIDNSINVLTYYYQMSDLNQLSQTDRFIESKAQLNMLENWTNYIKYDTTNEQLKQVYFRRYLDSVPIFSDGELSSRSEIGVLEDGLSHLKLPLTVIQIPIDLEDDPEVTLTDGRTLINNLSNLIELSEIQDLVIGVKWVNTDESSQVVTFDPQWFMKVENEWIDVESYMDQQEGGNTENGLSKD